MDFLKKTENAIFVQLIVKFAIQKRIVENALKEVTPSSESALAPAAKDFILTEKLAWNAEITASSAGHVTSALSASPVCFFKAPAACPAARMDSRKSMESVFRAKLAAKSATFRLRNVKSARLDFSF